MRRTAGLVLMGLSSFLLVTALMGWFYAPSATQKTPLNVDSETLLAGTATYLGEGPFKVKAVSRTVVDGDRSDDNVVVFTTVTCLVRDQNNPPGCVDKSDKRLINASSDEFATDRKTGEALQDEKYTSADDIHEGLINKFPFNVEQRTYPVWDGVLKKAVDAEFKGVEEIDGLETYLFQVTVPETKAEVAAGTQGTYKDTKKMWIHPRTGSIINQKDDQLRKVGTLTALALDLGFTDEQVAANVDDARGNDTKLGAVEKLPWGAAALALLSLIGGLLLLRGARARREDDVVYANEADDPTILDGLDDTTRRRDIHS